MPSLLMALMTLQLRIIDRYLAMTRDMFDLCLTPQPIPVKTSAPPAGRDLIVIERPVGRRSR